MADSHSRPAHETVDQPFWNREIQDFGNHSESATLDALLLVAAWLRISETMVWPQVIT
jgi:hypothetical protein